jgi:hypothetical protein
MILISWPGRIFEPQKNQKGSKNIGGRFYSIGNKGIGIPKYASHSLDYRQQGIASHAQVRSLYSFLMFVAFHKKDKKRPIRKLTFLTISV